MSLSSLTERPARAPVWFVATALAGIAWSAFGVVQFAGSVAAPAESLIASGLTPAEAAVMTGYPVWMTLAFGWVWLVGSVLLLLRKGLARGVLLASLLAYLALWISDAI